MALGTGEGSETPASGKKQKSKSTPTISTTSRNTTPSTSRNTSLSSIVRKLSNSDKRKQKPDAKKLKVGISKMSFKIILYRIFICYRFSKHIEISFASKLKMKYAYNDIEFGFENLVREHLLENF